MNIYYNSHSTFSGIKNFLLFFALLLFSLINTSRFRKRASKGGGQNGAIPPRTINPSDIALRSGYKIEPEVPGLTFLTAVVFDDQNNLYVIEAGYSYGESFGEPKLFTVDGDKTTLIAKGTNIGPWRGITWYDGAFYVAEGGEMTQERY